jgi:hypothetical protein
VVLRRGEDGMLGRDKTLKGDDTKGEDIASGDEVV